MDKTGRPELDNPDVFIAYASEDREKAVAIRNYIKKRGRSKVTVFMDTDTPGGVRYRDILPDQLEKSKVVLVLWSKIFAKKDFTVDEVDMARNQGKYFGVMLETLSKKETYGANQYSFVDLSHWSPGKKIGLERLFEDLCLFLGIEIPAEDPREDLEGLLTCLVNRTDELEDLEEILEGESETMAFETGDRALVMVDVGLEHCVDSFIKNLALKQLKNYSALSSGRAALSLMDQAIFQFSLDGSNKSAFKKKLLQSMEQKNFDCRGIESVSSWVNEGALLKVIYVFLETERQHKRMDVIIAGASALLKQLPEFDCDHKLAVVFECNRSRFVSEVESKSERSFLFGMFSKKDKQAPDELMGLKGVVDKVFNFYMVSSQHIKGWIGRWSPYMNDQYSKESIKSYLSGSIEGKDFSYEKLKQPLQDALENT